MAAPTNTTALTAIDVGTLPVTITQQVDDAGVTYTVWYKYTAVAGDDDIGVWPLGSLVVGQYRPLIEVMLGPASAPVDYLGGYFVRNKPVIIPVTPGETYYFKIDKVSGNPTPANLTLTCLPSPKTLITQGRILITEFAFAGDATLNSVDSGATVGFRRLLGPSDQGDVLPDGTFAVGNGTTGNVDLYDKDFNVIASVPGSMDSGINCITSNRADTFYSAHSNSAVNAQVQTISKTGVASGTLWTLPSNSRNLAGMAVNREGTILYYSRLASGEAIHAYDLVNAVALPDFAAGRVGTGSIKDMFCLPDGSLLVPYGDEKVYHYNSDGSTRTIFSTAVNLDRIFLDTDDLHLWTWTQAGTNPALSTFKKLVIADGTALLTVTNPLFGTGIASSVAALVMDQFGASNSCPLLVMPVLAEPLPNGCPAGVDLAAVAGRAGCAAGV